MKNHSTDFNVMLTRQGLCYALRLGSLDSYIYIFV